MNFSKEDIKKMIDEGASIESIVADFTNTINEVETEMADAEAMVARRTAEKIEDMRTVIQTIFDFFHEWYPEFDELMSNAKSLTNNDEDIMDIIKAIDEYLNLFQSINTLKAMVTSGDTKTDNVAEIFEEFFKNNNI